MNLRIPGIAAIRSHFCFSGKRLWKPEFIIMGFVAALALYWVFETAGEIRALQTTREKVSLPTLGIGIQNLERKPHAGEFVHIGEFRVWGFNSSEAGAAETEAGKAGASASFAQKEFDNVPAVYSLADNKYRWEFYGVVGHGSKRAVFFNPAEKGSGNSGWRQFAQGEPMDGNLVLEEIGKNKAVIFWSKEHKSFVLELFRVEATLMPPAIK